MNSNGVNINLIIVKYNHNYYYSLQ